MQPLVLAYIGPGAGIAFVTSFLIVFMAMFSALVSLATWPIRRLINAVRSRRAMKHARVKRVVIMGLDGLEPTLVDRYLDEDIMPNLAKLRDSGTYQTLGTTNPPLSPVAWSSFSTGTNPGKHNIFDFVSRRTSDYLPEVSSVQFAPARRELKLGRYTIPLSRPQFIANRKSRPFWNVLGDHGIFSSVIRVPISFPPDRFRGVQLAAMCVPDLLGTQGTYSYFTESNDAPSDEDVDRGDIEGRVINLERRGNELHADFTGPPNPFRRDRNATRVSLRVIAKQDGTAELFVDGEKFTLKEGQWSDWIRIAFRTSVGVKISGICRFLIKQVQSPFSMYCSPIHIDPARPAMPIAHPAAYSIYVGNHQGPFATLGLAEDTEGLSDGVLSDDDFLRQAYDIHDERERMFMDCLDRVSRGVVVCVFDLPDRLQHMFWRFIDDGHPALAQHNDNPRNGNHQDTIRDMYIKMDQLVGRLMRRVGKDTAVFVISDHGFKTFRRCVDLNCWLREQGYLKLKGELENSDKPYLADVDWSETKAYAIGLAGIYVNQAGRERDGIVKPGTETQTLVKELSAKLLEMRDEVDDRAVVLEAVSREAAYQGPYVNNAPDVVIGYHEGYRVSWRSSVGKCARETLFDNTRAWSGDHCIHPRLVPGVLFSNLRLDADKADITDIAPTTLELMGVDIPPYIDGQSLLCSAENS